MENWGLVLRLKAVESWGLVQRLKVVEGLGLVLRLNLVEGFALRLSLVLRLKVEGLGMVSMEEGFLLPLQLQLGDSPATALIYI